MKGWQLGVIVLLVVAGIAGAVILTQLGHRGSTSPAPSQVNVTTPVKIGNSTVNSTKSSVPPPTNTTVTSNNTSTSKQNETAIPPGAQELKFDAQNKTVFIYLTVTPANNYLNYNGSSYGSMKIYVPAGWTLLITFYNPGPLYHGLALIQNSTAMPSQPNILQQGKVLLLLGYNGGNGIPPGSSVSGTYMNISSGYYWLACPVYGHASSGMWVDLIASPNVMVPYEMG